ncbi:MAG: hypothetical protein P1P90_04920, partial [Patescibacteria group bacterium]|nr:hypothetical protein [Patescibacteria group bacterium]
MNFMEKYFLNFSLSLDPVALSLRKLRSGRITQYIWLARALARPIFAKNSLIFKGILANIRYTETLAEKFLFFFLVHG